MIRLEKLVVQSALRFMTLLLILAVAGAIPPAAAYAQGNDQPLVVEEAATPSWLEPRGLSVLDLVGQVPEEHLRGSIIYFNSAGVMRYLRGERIGNKVIIEVSMSTLVVEHNDGIKTELGCMTKWPTFDEWTVAVPASEMRIFSKGKDVTDQVIPWFHFSPAQLSEPIWGSGGGKSEVRYHIARNIPHQFTEDGALIIPPTMGCYIWFRGIVPDLTAEFVFDYPPRIQVETLGSETFTFGSYIGVGVAGLLDSLRSQMYARFGNRHDKFVLKKLPPEADYVWLNYPPTPVSLYTSQFIDQNLLLPFTGTYRLIGRELSTDHMLSMGLPVHAQWTDADLAGGRWLPGNGQVNMISAPEYFLPPGMDYDPCMRYGGCPAWLLDQIYNKETEMTLYYYRVRRLTTGSYFRAPLYAVGPDWRPGDTPYGIGLNDGPPPVNATPFTGTFPQNSVNLPIIAAQPAPPLYPDDAPQAGCPCGWFDEHYRMLDYIPGLPVQ